MSRLENEKKNLENESIAGKSFLFIKKTFQEIDATEDWGSLAFPDIRKALEDKLNLPPSLSRSDVDKLKSLVNEYTKEKNIQSGRSTEQIKKDQNNNNNPEEQDRQRKRSKSTSEKDSPKHKRTSSSKQNKSRKHKYSDSDLDSISESDESQDHKRKTKKQKIDLSDPQVKKIESLKKIIRGCGLPLTGLGNKYDGKTLKSLQTIISQHEKDGMKEKMSRSQMSKVRSLLEKQREIDELKNIPKKLIVKEGSTRDRRKTKKKINYAYEFPKTGTDLDEEDESESESSSTSIYSD